MSTDTQDTNRRTSLSGSVSNLMRALSLTRSSRADAQLNATPAQDTTSEAQPTSFDRFLELLNVKRPALAPFPPANWFTGGDSNTTATPTTPAGDEEVAAAVAEEVDEVPPPLTPAPEAEAPDRQTSNADVPEPTFLARKIRDLITSMMPAPPSGDAHTPGDADPPPPAPVRDTLLVKMLSSATIMNGTFSKGRQSVFAILDRLKSPWAHNHPRADGSGGAQEGHEERLEEDDNSSVMLYGPLSPDSDSVVELAQSEVISLGEDEEPGTPTVVGYNDNPEQPAAGEPSQNSGTRKGWPNLQWPWYGMKGKARAEASEKRVHVGEKIWVPSRTKISLQVMWWGYRIYLPPPVLAVLSNQELTAAKRAAMFTTALKWLCDHIPVSLLPLQLRPAAILVRRLIPYVGYIGGFVAWSWSAVKSYDKGNGVVLTATWLLSVAVIPSTWEPNNPPTSPEAPGLTVPLPSQPQTPQVGTSNRA